MGYRDVAAATANVKQHDPTVGSNVSVIFVTFVIATAPKYVKFFWTKSVSWPIVHHATTLLSWWWWYLFPTHWKVWKKTSATILFGFLQNGQKRALIEKWFIIFFEQSLFFGPLCTTPLHRRRDDNDTSSQLIIILHHCPEAKGKQQLLAWWYSTGSRQFKDNDRILGMI
mgnify:CR=1 FL=1